MTILELLERFEPRLRDAFFAGVNEIRSKAIIKDIAAALENGDIAKAVGLLYIESAAFDAFLREIEAAYGNGGLSTIGALGTIRDQSGQRFVIRFDARNTRAERWLRDYSSNLVTRIVEEQKASIRQHMQTGMEAGRNPRSVALDIVGRIDSRTKRREGGIVGLSAPQERAVARAREELENGDFASYRQRTRRDKRFDATLAKAEREGKALTQKQIDGMVARYSDRLLKLRGDTIARTEALASLHAAQDEALRQLVESGKVSASQVSRVWDATGDRRTRFDHALADGQAVGLDEMFLIGGRRMKYPGDPSGGAAQVINCRCHVRVKIDFLQGVS